MELGKIYTTIILSITLSCQTCVAMENNENIALIKRRSAPSYLNIDHINKVKNKAADPFVNVELNENNFHEEFKTSNLKKIKNVKEINDFIQLNNKNTFCHKFVFFDIDNTVLDKYSNLICQETPQILEDLANLGFYIIFVTARNSDPICRRITYYALKNVGIDTFKLAESYQKNGGKILFSDLIDKHDTLDSEAYEGISQLESHILFTTIQGIKGPQVMKLLLLHGINLKKANINFIDDSDLEIKTFTKTMLKLEVDGQVFKFR